MGKFTPRTTLITAYQYTGTSMDPQVAALLGASNCVAASGTRPALIHMVNEHRWAELRPTMWAVVSDSGIQLLGNREFVMKYRNVDAEPAIPAPVDPGPDVYV